MKLPQKSPEEDVVVFARAEQRLCESSGPALAAVVEALALQDGLRITELRVTFDWNGQDAQLGAQLGAQVGSHSDGHVDGHGGGSILANCTIVKAQYLPVSNGGTEEQPPLPRHDASRSTNGESGDAGSA